MFPVCKKSAPDVFDQFHIRCARSRAWVFCSVRAVSLESPSICRAAANSRSNASSIGTTFSGIDSSEQIVSAAGQSDAHRPKGAGLLEVVADAERQRVENFLAPFLPRGWAGFLRRQEEAALLRNWVLELLATGGEIRRRNLQERHQRVRGGVAFAIDAPGGVLGPQARGAVEINRSRGVPLAKPRCHHHPFAVLIEVTASVEYQAVVAAERVGVGDGALVIGRAGGNQLAAALLRSNPERRGGDIRDQLGS